MNKIALRVIAAVTAAGLCVGGVHAAYAVNGKDEKTEPQKYVSTIEEKENAPVKDETVYVLAGADGSVNKIIVSDWIKNSLYESGLNDVSELSNIENVKGDETYTSSDANSKLWNANGNDIYYMGNINKELPVSVSVSYMLDGVPVKASEIAGKSGHAVIRYDYKSLQSVKVEGCEEEIRVPFAVVTGMLLDNDVFRNVTVKNGKLINDGDRMIVAGIALPGLNEAFGVGEEEVKLPDYIEIEADVTEFELGMSISLATNELFGGVDIDAANIDLGLDELTGKLTDAMNQLTDGSGALYDGLSTLLDKSGELTDGIGLLADGSHELNAGAVALAEGAGQLEGGIGELETGLNKLVSNNDVLNTGAKTVFETLLNTANTQIAAAGINADKLTIDNYSAVLQGVIDSLDEKNVKALALDTVKSKVEENRGYITAMVTEAVKAQVEPKVTEAVKAQVTEQVKLAVAQQAASLPAGSMTEEQVAAIIASNTDAQMNTDEVKAIIAAQLELQMQSDEVKALIATNVEAQVEKAVNDNMKSDEVKAKLAAAKEGKASLISLLDSLNSYSVFYQGIKTYTDGVATAAVGAKVIHDGSITLNGGAVALADGAQALTDGVDSLNDATPALVDGITQLKDGSGKLKDGIAQFNDEAVAKLVSVLNDTLKGKADKVKNVMDASRSYRNFSGISDEMDGSVKFIYRTEAIEK